MNDNYLWDKHNLLEFTGVQVYGKFVTSSLIGTKEIKSKEIRVITYTCRYTSGHLIPVLNVHYSISAGVRIVQS